MTVTRPSPDVGTVPGGRGVSDGGQGARVLEVIVIGAGQAGLAAAGELVRRGMVPGRELLVLDAEEGPGGAWRHRWDSLTIGRAHHIADLPHFPAGELDATRPSSAVVPEYYGRFEKARGLDVLRPVRVTAVRSTDLPAAPLAVPGGAAAGAGVVRRDTLMAVEASTPQGPRTWLTRMVISAAGTWSHPYVPYVPGVETFAGRQLHTVGYRRAEDFAGQRVVVVGGGLSAVQMLLEIAPYTATTTWATRRPPGFTTVDFDEVWGAEVEQAVDARTSAGRRTVSVVRATGIPMLPAYLDGVRSGVLVSRGMFDRIGAEGVCFSPAATVRDSDGLVHGTGLVVPESWDPYREPTWVQADVIVWNTGFRAALSHLAPLRLRDSGIRMAGRVAVAADPRVLLVGYGSSASTHGATRAGSLAARTALRRLQPRRATRS